MVYSSIHTPRPPTPRSLSRPVFLKGLVSSESDGEAELDRLCNQLYCLG